MGETIINLEFDILLNNYSKVRVKKKRHFQVKKKFTTPSHSLKELLSKNTFLRKKKKGKNEENTMNRETHKYFSTMME